MGLYCTEAFIQSDSCMFICKNVTICKIKKVTTFNGITILYLSKINLLQVSTLKCGFLPMSQEALICGEVSYHEYNGILVDQEERDALQRHLGPNNKVGFTEEVILITKKSFIDSMLTPRFHLM